MISTTQTEKILQGCGKELGRSELHEDLDGEETAIIICEKDNLCSECKAQALGRLNTQKEEVEWIQNSETTREFSYCEDIKERISTLKSCITKLEEAKK